MICLVEWPVIGDLPSKIATHRWICTVKGQCIGDLPGKMASYRWFAQQKYVKIAIFYDFLQLCEFTKKANHVFCTASVNQHIPAPWSPRLKTWNWALLPLGLALPQKYPGFCLYPGSTGHPLAPKKATFLKDRGFHTAGTASGTASSPGHSRHGGIPWLSMRKWWKIRWISWYSMIFLGLWL